MRTSSSGSRRAPGSNEAPRRATGMPSFPLIAIGVGGRAPRSCLRIVAVGAFLSFLAVGPIGPVVAQDQPSIGFSRPGTPPKAQGKAPSRILIISVQRLTRDSKAGASISRQAERLRSELLAPLEKKQDALREEEKALVKLRDTLPRPEFETRVDAFKNELRAVRAAEQTALARLQAGLRRATSEFRRARDMVLTDLMRRYDGAVMLDEASVVLSANSLNVTDEAIKRLDESTPEVQVILPEAADGE